MATIDETRSLTDLEGDDWGPAPADATRLVESAHRLRRTPLAELSPGDVRLLLGQQISAEILVPKALGLLRAEPLLTAGFYPGDLLSAVLTQPSSYWAAHPDQRDQVLAILAGVDAPTSDIRREIKLFRDVVGVRGQR